MSNSPKIQRTTDLYFAAFLQTFGLPLVGTPREGTRVYFEFDSSLCDYETVKNAWYTGQGKVSARDMSNNIKNLKSLCHS
jgi:hypothetical protein